ncbi:hypothetical protein P153DRAFT_208276 [Dothidotthia symphoricarpi CBS 119687]|uniref:Secreted protein n=1 Tax=Dothidotthia symphoricarpi CBS 119687 TaxID=1392245 RepID=A0A6A6AKL7_9PLEO|nr:uncharacterized protein P153DRAFT_208276 [Dothidotthia symphoricarpi CBS 119687]KAF2130981.1 hypothetical protein P153DRAFT_208276 [Dothidotthia symphoricarpi CBS 119687]
MLLHRCIFTQCWLSRQTSASTVTSSVRVTIGLVPYLKGLGNLFDINEPWWRVIWCGPGTLMTLHLNVSTTLYRSKEHRMSGTSRCRADRLNDQSTCFTGTE